MIRQLTLRSEIFPPTPNHVPGYARKPPSPIVEGDILEEPFCASPEPAFSFDDDFNETEDDPATLAMVAEFMRNRRNYERVMEHLHQIPPSSSRLSPQLSPRLSPRSSPRVSPRLAPRDWYPPEMSQSQVNPPERQDTRISITSASTPSTIRNDSNHIPIGNPSSSTRPRGYPRNSTLPDHDLNNIRRHSTLSVPPSGVNIHSNDGASIGITSVILVFTNRSKHG